MTKILYSLLGLFIFSGVVLSAQEYQTDYASTYVIDRNGLAQVSHNVRIQNNFANIFATAYTISIGSNNIENISATDDGSNINVEIEKSENTTVITIPITNPTIGREQVKELNITYSNPDIALQAGNIWEINIPKLSNANEINQYSRSLIVPISFPEATTSIPKPKIEETDTGRLYSWSGHENESITMFFGEEQFYQLNLKYEITNPTIQDQDTEIAIPPDTEYQRIYLEEISPEPNKITQDPDGNWLATYSLKKKESITIKIKLFARVVAVPTFTIPYTNSNLDKLTSKTNIWDTKSQNISSLAKQLKTPENIYNYLVDTLSYNYNRVGMGADRLGAVNAINNPTQAICTEFTDAFVAMTRSINIPAREINGYAYTTNTSLRPLSLEVDILHAWPEFYDKSKDTWTQVDPTWGNTTGGIDYFSKLDFNHITFVRHGLEDSYPFPAGAYKLDSSSKAIDVTILTEKPKEIIDVRTKSLGLSSGIIEVSNMGNSALINYLVELDNGESVLIDYLPPYGKQEVLSKGEDSASKINSNTIILISITGLIILILLFTLTRKRK